MSASDAAGTPRVEWRRNDSHTQCCCGWWLVSSFGRRLGLVYADGRWFVSGQIALHSAGSQPLAAQALLRAVGVSQ